MAIRFKYGGVSFTADTPEEAAQTMALLKRKEEDAALERARRRFLATTGGSLQERLDAHLSEEAETPWTPDVFFSFMDRLGEAQKAALALLVRRQHVTDEDMRNELHVSGNQALAGILSGISKQAAALNVPARAIFSFENFRNAGTRRSTYTVSDKFLRIAADMVWPGPDFPSEK